MPRKPEGTRQRRFEKPVEVTLSSRSKGTSLFGGEALGVNDNGLGANVRGFPDVPPAAVGDVYRVRFHVPVEFEDVPLARVIRIDPPLTKRGDPEATRWECHLALRFETPFDSGLLFSAAMPRAREIPATSLHASRQSARRRLRDG